MSGFMEEGETPGSLELSVANEVGAYDYFVLFRKSGNRELLRYLGKPVKVTGSVIDSLGKKYLQVERVEPVRDSLN